MSNGFFHPSKESGLNYGVTKLGLTIIDFAAKHEARQWFLPVTVNENPGDSCNPASGLLIVKVTGGVRINAME